MVSGGVGDRGGRRNRRRHGVPRAASIHDGSGTNGGKGCGIGDRGGGEAGGGDRGGWDAGGGGNRRERRQGSVRAGGRGLAGNFRARKESNGRGIGSPYLARGAGGSRTNLGAFQNFGTCLGSLLDQVLFGSNPQIRIGVLFGGSAGRWLLRPRTKEERTSHRHNWFLGYKSEDCLSAGATASCVKTENDFMVKQCLSGTNVLPATVEIK